MKKEIIAIVLALVLVMGLSTVAFAEENQNTGDQKTENGLSTTIEFTVPESYTWSVPQTLSLSPNGTIDGTVTASNVLIEYGKELTVAAEEKVELTYKDDTVESNVTYTNLEVEAGEGFNTTKNQGITVTAPTGFKYAGTYIGTITFTAKVADADAGQAQK